MIRKHDMPFGASVGEAGVRFRLWAPGVSGVSVVIDDADGLPLTPKADGWFERVTSSAKPGSRYRYVLAGGQAVPDPASRFQPDDVAGDSEVVDPQTYDWSDDAWTGRPWNEAVVYELHVGAFTADGTFASAAARIGHLAELGVTAIEIMPVADFPGRRNWGYDGVLLYAPDSTYGRPDDFKAFVEAAHAAGIMVLLDVVYNHFGPDGNYLPAYAPSFFTDRHKTPWGDAINYDGPDSGPVREFVIHNALYWIEEFHLDGLRLDAVHAIIDDGPEPLLNELARRVRSAVTDRPIHLILENEENAAHLLTRSANGAADVFTAQWNDDVHHVLHTAATGETSGYYEDYAGDTEKLGRALSEGFAFQGEMMPYRGSPRGERSDALPPAAFVSFIQNHDQIGNRAFGDRITNIARPEALRAIAAIAMLLPQTPLLFMGQEWSAGRPFPFFCDFRGELAAAVSEGRRAEFARFPEFADPASREKIPDPEADATFASAKLDWNELTREPHAETLDWYRRILSVRGTVIAPLIPFISKSGTHTALAPGAVCVRWAADNGVFLELIANLSDAGIPTPPEPRGMRFWSDGDAGDGTFRPVERHLVDHAAAMSSIDELAAAYGIEAEFVDAHGKTQTTSAETKRTLLQALGADVADGTAARAARSALEERAWRCALPPVLVTSGEPLSVPVSVPQALTALNWQLALEDGSQRSGSANRSDLELLDTRTIGEQRVERRALVLPHGIPFGYHQLHIEGFDDRMTLVVTPGSCALPSGLIERKGWGIAVQLYALRSERNWGIGDFDDLQRLTGIAAAGGADVIGLNPLHAMFLDDPEHASPYSPASRLLLNVLNIDVGGVPGFKETVSALDLFESAEFQARLTSCRTSAHVRYADVAGLKLSMLKLVYAGAHSRAESPTFEAFIAEGAGALRDGCLFQVLRDFFVSRDPKLADWRNWPPDYQDAHSSTVREFEAGHADELRFQYWLQWIADEQLAGAAAAVTAAGMRVGLYRDLAVGSDPSGVEAWSNPRAVVQGASVGAPPDILNTKGQNWALPPFHPMGLRDEAYRSFIALVRSNMRHAGAIRIDHVMALQHLYLIPNGAEAADGAYVRYPIEDLVGILALESVRNNCLVIGEDLGTVPAGFRERMAAANILSYRVLFFERSEDAEFVSPEAYPEAALAVVASHDLSTLRAWLDASDIDLRLEIGSIDDRQADEQRAQRASDREALLSALIREKVLASVRRDDVEAIVTAAHAYLAHTPAVLVMAQLDDITGERAPVNLPATTDQYPNWRRRISVGLEDLAALKSFLHIAEAFAAAGRTNG